MDKNEQLAKRIVDYSCQIKSGQRVLIQMIGNCSQPLVLALIKELNQMGSWVDVLNLEPSITAELIKGITVEQAETIANRDLELVKLADVCIMVKSIEDESILVDLPQEKERIYALKYRNVIDQAILSSTRWISLRYPNRTMAAEAAMSYEDFEAYFFQVCTIDYKQLSQAMTVLVDMMAATDMVRVTGPGTALSFSIKDMPIHKCDGLINLPDGEVYTAPVRNSINGYVRYNVPTTYRGHKFNSIELEFHNGKIVEAKCDPSEKLDVLNNMLNTDEGSRYIGEFALGVNPYIKQPIRDILFDEKIAGSFHLTPGFSYKDAYNGNDSAIHWDLVCIQTKIYGGGEIYFDGKLIRKDGKFVLEALKILNPK